MAEAKSENKKAETREHPVPFWEWIIAAFGLLLVLGAIGTTLYRAAFEESTPPILEFIVDEIQPTAKGYLVRFRVKNTGSQTAAGLAIEGSLRRGEESVETSTASLTYAPANSQREGGLFFTKNPSEFDLLIRATGYEKP
ncbi:MAG: hypothetical protein ABR535_08825 [Pyrinomonadaceae bacterium]